MLPIRDDNPTRHVPYVTLVIIALNALVFLLWEPTFAAGTQRQVEVRQQTFFYCHAEIPYEITHQTNLAQGGAGARAAIDRAGLEVSGRELQDFLRVNCPGKSWLLAIFVAMFLHGGWLHLAGNMLFLWVFGNNVEDRLGSVKYALFYLLSGVVASLAQLATGPDSVIPNLGASGAIAGVLGAYLVMFPRRRVLTVVIFFLITFVYVPAIVVLGLWFVLQLFDGVGALSRPDSGGIAFWAHIGGFAFGALTALLFFPKEGFARPRPRRPDLPVGASRAWRRRPMPPVAGPPTGSAPARPDLDASS